MNIRDLYVVVDHFKAGGAFFPAGKVLTAEEVKSIRLYKVRMNEGKIVQLTEDKVRLEYIFRRLKVRYGVDIRETVAERISKGSESAENPNASASTPTGTPSAQPKSGVKQVISVPKTAPVKK